MPRKNITLLFLIATLMTTGSYAQTSPGLLAYYPFDGNGNDASGNSRNLADSYDANHVGEPIEYVTGKFQQAIGRKYQDYASFIAADLSQFPNYINEFSLSVWLCFEKVHGNVTSTGADPIAMDDQAGRRTRCEKREVVHIGRRRHRYKSADFRPPHEQLHADPGAERKPGDPTLAGLGVDALQPIERGCGVR